MPPLVAIVGRPNVGKSTLFNRLVGGREAIVEPTPGVTRDRHYGSASWSGRDFLLVDTGGIGLAPTTELVRSVAHQTTLAIEVADLILFLVDGREGVTGGDKEVAETLRRSGKPLLLVVNKIDGQGQEANVAEFYDLGIGALYPVSAEHGRGVGDLLDALLPLLPHPPPEETPEGAPVAVAVAGRPNVGKSSLVNCLLGEERVIVDVEPGTTRDAIDTPLRVGGREYLLIDTAGIRRRGKLRLPLERYSVLSALKSFARADVALLLLDATEGVMAQDARIAGYALSAGAGLILVVNKWDIVPEGRKDVRLWEQEIRDQMRHVSFAPILVVSALTGQRISRLFPLIDRVAAERSKRVPPAEVTKALEEILAHHPPPMVGRRPLRFYSGKQVGVRPPTFLFSVNQPEGVHFSYERYLTNQIRGRFGFEGTPIRLLFRGRRAPPSRGRVGPPGRALTRDLGPC